MKQDGVLHLRAHAKINLLLRVGPRRRDGYHGIVTLFQSISTADHLCIRRRTGQSAGGLRIDVDDPTVPADSRNTISKAYAYFCRRHPEARDDRWEVTLHKKIPHGSGLGGGSADAAAFLIGAAQLLGVRALRCSRAAIAREVGADVPFCLTGGTALGRGLGECLLRRRPFPAYRVFLVLPNIRISTKEAYDALDRLPRRKNLTKAVSAHSLKAVDWGIHHKLTPPQCPNDFQSQACLAHGEMAQLADRLSPLGYSAMSGSGSAFFVIPKTGVDLKIIQSAAGRAAGIEARFARRGVDVMR